MTESKLRLLGWECAGLRCPDYSVDLRGTGGTCYRVSLLQMPNGTGKTTTLALLRAALSGHAPDGGPWADYNLDSLRGEGAATGSFVVDVEHNSERWSFRVEFDFANREVELFTTGPAGDDPGFRPPRSLETLLTPGFVRFFVFDGELAHRLADPGAHNADHAIDALFRLRSFSQMNQWAREYFEKRLDEQRRSGAGTSSTEQGYERQRNLIARLERRAAELEEKKEEAEARRETLAAEVARLERENREALERQDRFKKEYDEAVATEANKRDLLKQKTQSVLDEMREPQHLASEFATGIYRLRDAFERVQLPGSGAKEWFEELSEESVCVCGRTLGEAEREHIRENAERYLGSDEVWMLNQIKSDIANHVDPEPSGNVRQLTDMLDELENLSDEHSRARADIQRINEQAADADPGVGGILDRLREKDSELQSVIRELNRFEEPDTSNIPENQYNLSEVNARLQQERRSFDEINKTARLRDQTDRLEQLFQDTRKRVRKIVARHLTDKVNSSLDRLLPDNPVRLSGIDKSLRLEKQEAASVGETLTVAYAFLTHLTTESAMSVPLVVDTPAAPIDKAIRSRIGRILPQLLDQFVAFTISSEREGFVGPLEECARGQVQHVTIVGKHHTRLAKGVDPSWATVADTGGAFVLYDREYFYRFQDESEYHRSTEVIEEATEERDNV